ncbi:MAG: hypothetical protein SVY10_09015 [Thermodesulfobacteriota bacterium]|nr:hypothetical protein [Thermodesulfobacteriota bacterium]
MSFQMFARFLRIRSKRNKEPALKALSVLESGEMSEGRYRSYKKLVKESEYHQMSCVEKRRKDREFGQFIKSVIKQNKKE